MNNIDRYQENKYPKKSLFRTVMPVFVWYSGFALLGVYDANGDATMGQFGPKEEKDTGGPEQHLYQ